MSRSSEQPIKIFCDGGCGKSQSVRPSKIDRRYTHIGCGKCEGWVRLKASFRTDRDEMICEYDFYAAGGFEGMRLRIATVEERAALERARALVQIAREQGLA
ncbi:hypothetical protein GOFOIKOB_3984 [Methylobacterium tardum]|uniref:Uncharacterized protein n=1 Tax=Methylobacterium tardum TaxID=374432 RepID=A0AA37TI35_9HYPH|nr:hypothetical protein [Methylobacterium tardum]GJE50930.1 hypothetical protein GOFOIKOB_3984 [Methylobacterium tardum]GLS69931.1 hypothetical protein GCM10007890_19440 [Methylobacterium tardum]